MFKLDQYYLLNLINKNNASTIIDSLSNAELNGISNYSANFWRKLDHPAEYFFYILVAEKKFDIIKQLNTPEGFAQYVGDLNTPFIQICINSCATDDEFQVLKPFLDSAITYDPKLLILEDSNKEGPLQRAVSQNKIFAVHYLLDCFINNTNKLTKAHRQFFQLPQNVPDEIKTELDKYGISLLAYDHLGLVSPAFASPTAFLQALTTQSICSNQNFWRHYLNDLYRTSNTIKQHLYAYNLLKTLSDNDTNIVLVGDDTAAQTALATELLSVLKVLSTNLNRLAYYHSLTPFNLMRRMSESVIHYYKNDRLRNVNANMAVFTLIGLALIFVSDPLHDMGDKAYEAHQKFESLFKNLTMTITDCAVQQAIQHCDLRLSKIPSFIDCTSFNNTENCDLFNTTYSDCYTYTAQWEQARTIVVVVFILLFTMEGMNMFLKAGDTNYASPITCFNIFILTFPFLVLNKLLGAYQPYESSNQNAVILAIWSLCESFSKIPCASLFEGNDEKTLATLTNDSRLSNEEVITSIDQFGTVIEKYIELVPELPHQSRMPKASLESVIKKVKKINQTEDNSRRSQYFNFFLSPNRDIEMNELTNTNGYNHV
ncbi:MAG: hypothetical protein WC627_11290 [Legionella sp.]|jgi:hypothetical protein